MTSRWHQSTLGALCAISSGGTPSRSNEAYWSGKTPWVSAKDLKSDRIFDAELHISRRAVDESATKVAPVGSLLMLVRGMGLAKGVPIGEVTAPVAFNQDIRAIHPPSGVLPRFLLLALRHALASKDGQGLLSSAAHGTLKIDSDALRRVPLSVPTAAEQRRIVGILDEAFAGIATAKANVERNLYNARAVFNTHLHSVFTKRGPGWVEKKFEEVVDADCSLSYGIVQPGDEYLGGIPVVRPTDLTTRVVRLNGLKSIDPRLAGSYKRTALQGGELLLCVRGSTGVVSIASPELVGANVTRGIVPIRFDRATLMPEFAFHLIRSELVQGQIRAKTYGAALMQINIRDLRAISLSFPPLREQAAISARLDSLSRETELLASLYRRKLAALEELTRCLLHHAFTGQL